MFLNNYRCILLNYTSKSQHPDILHDLFGYCLFWFILGIVVLCSQWCTILNINPLFLSSVCFAASSVPSPVIAIVLNLDG